MSILYGQLKKASSAGNDELLQLLAGNLRRRGAAEYTFHFHGLQGGVILHPVFETDPMAYIYYSYEEHVVVLVSGYFFNRDELLAHVNKREMYNPELAFHLFRIRGKEFANDINGDFTIIIYKADTGVLLMYRDHVGIRPLSWHAGKGSFWFSSDGTVLSKILCGGKKIDREYLQRYLENGDTVNLNLLPCREVMKLLPGTFLETRHDGKPVVKKYWFPEKIKENKTLDIKTAKRDLTELVKHAVSIRSDSRLKAAAHLSGGLDSGIIAALARVNYDHQASFKGFSWSPPYDEVSFVKGDERKLVDETGKACHIEPVYLKLGMQDVAKFYNNCKIPGRSVHETAIRKAVQEENISLLFSGWGGDEFISLNNRGVDSDLFFSLKWKLFFRRNPIYHPLSSFKSVIRRVILPGAGLDFTLMRESHSPYLKKRRPFYRTRFSPLYKWKSRRDVHLALLNFCHLAERAEQWFLDGYQEGVEYRYPLLDKRIIEYMLTVPSLLLVRKGYSRLMLREVSEDILPASVAWSKSKSNPAMFEKTKRACSEIYEEAVHQIEEFKRNPDFDFINFSALEKDIAVKPDFRDADLIPEHAVFILMLKQLHAFTQEYYAPPEKAVIENLPEEQNICISCGFCCDGTLFDNATLQPGETDNLPDDLKKNCYDKEKGAFFHLPCQYFSGKCTRYSGVRLQICSHFRCKLLTDFEKQLLTPGNVYQIIDNVRVHLKEITRLAHDVLQLEEQVTFREIQQMLGKLPEEMKEDILTKVLAGRCNILDALLIRHFKTENEFRKMITTEASMT